MSARLLVFSAATKDVEFGQNVDGDSNPASAAVRQKFVSRGVETLRKAVELMERSECVVDRSTYACLLQQCYNAKALPEGKRIHAHIDRRGYDGQTFLGNFLVQMYGKCASVEDARLAFERIRQPNVFSWTIMLAAFAENGHLEEATCTFNAMPQKNVVSWTAMIVAYAQNGHLQDARRLFDEMPEQVKVGNALLSMYGKCRALQEAKNVFDQMAEQSTVSWNAMITAYAHNGHVKDARSLFDNSPQKDVASYNSLITAYSQNGYPKGAFEIFQLILLDHVEPNEVTLLSVLESCSSVSDVTAVSEVAADNGLASDTRVANAILNGYGKCGALQDARMVFDKMVRRDVVSWNVMLGAYVQNKHGTEAMKLFQWMDLEGVEPDEVTFITVIDACSLTGQSSRSLMHDRANATGFASNVKVATALVSMYGKCGKADIAHGVFSKMDVKNVISWTAAIVSYAQNGHDKKALELFQTMALEGLHPDGVTFISIISACSYAGLLDDGWSYFASMHSDFGLVPTQDHHLCMLDLLGRAGLLDEAELLANKMPVETNALAWRTLLGSCRVHSDTQRAQRIAEHASVLDSQSPAPYLLLSNMYAANVSVSSSRRVKDSQPQSTNVEEA